MQHSTMFQLFCLVTLVSVSVVADVVGTFGVAPGCIRTDCVVLGDDRWFLVFHFLSFCGIATFVRIREKTSFSIANPLLNAHFNLNLPPVGQAI